MLYLAIDTANALTSVATITKDGEVINELSSTSPMQQVREAPSLIKKICEESNLSLNSFCGIIITIGPGSFTGCRIGISLVKGISLGNKLPVMKTTTLELVAAHAVTQNTTKSQVLVLLDGSRKQVYTSCFNNNLEVLSSASLLEYNEARNLAESYPEAYIVGNGAKPAGLHTNLPISPTAAMAGSLIKLQGFSSSETQDILPLYLRSAV